MMDEYESTIIKRACVKEWRRLQNGQETSFLYKECVMYPVVNTIEKRDTHIVLNTELCDILSFIESTGISAL